MFDPEVDLDARLAAELGLKAGTHIPFFPKIDTEEQELKYSTTAFQKIRQSIHGAPNRLVDTNAWTANPYVLVTLNLDTLDRQLAKAGFSLRVRFAYNGDNKIQPITSIDMCIKTTLVSDSNIALFKQTRGEWETDLPNLRTNMQKMIDHHKLSDGQRGELPDFFKDGHIGDDQYFVESIGATMRNVYPSFEKFFRHGKTVVTAFQHTEDWQNIFMTPYGDTITGRDNEAECEFLGFYNMSPDDIDAAGYEKLMRKSLRLMDRTIVGADMANVKHNMVTKSMRGRNGLETVYGRPLADHEGLSDTFDMASSIREASLFALSQRVRPQDVILENIWHHTAGMKAQVERMMAAKEDTFEHSEFRLA